MLEPLSWFVSWFLLLDVLYGQWYFTDRSVGCKVQESLSRVVELRYVSIQLAGPGTGSGAGMRVP